MKQTDIKHCALCGKGVMHSNQLAFYRVKLQHMIVNVGAVRRQAGLEMMVGNPMIAFHMGPQENMAEPVGDELDILICQECSIRHPHCAIAFLAERANEKAKGTDGA